MVESSAQMEGDRAVDSSTPSHLDSSFVETRTVLRLPPELLALCAAHLSVRDLQNAAGVCSVFNKTMRPEGMLPDSGVLIYTFVLVLTRV